jgi:DNA-binding CsgD family transcriptional regulator
VRRGRPPYPDVLTPREWEVLSLIQEGLTNDQITERLSISGSGAQFYVAEILSKLGVESRKEAAEWRAPRKPFSLGSLLITSGAAAATAVALLTMTSNLLADEDGKLFPHMDYEKVTVAPEKQVEDRWKGLTSEQKLAEIDFAHKRQDEFVKEFQASGRDPRSLKRINRPSYGAPMPSLQATVDAADLIVLGTVTGVQFTTEPDEMSFATVSVEQTFKGGALAGGELTVGQVGGPSWTRDGGQLVQLETDELLLSGDRAMLILKAKGETLHALLGSGIVFIRDGLSFPEAVNVFGADILNQSLAQLLAMIERELRQ